MCEPITIGALVSGGGTNLQAIMDACRRREINARMAFVGSDNPHAAALDRARDNGLATFIVDYDAIIRRYREDPSAFQCPQPRKIVDTVLQRCREAGLVPRDGGEPYIHTRLAAETRLLSEMAPYAVDLLVLAGFMRTLSPFFIDAVNAASTDPRIMNIHPALLPAFPGMDGYGDTFRYGCKVGGCTVHFVDYGEDTGPIIGQRAFSIADNDTLDDVRRKGLALEWELYPECIQRFAQKRLKVEKRTWQTRPGRSVSRLVVVERIQASEPLNP